MGNFVKVILFSFAVLAFYTLFSTVYIPKIEPSPPPPRPVGGLLETMDEVLAMGEKIFTDTQQGNCDLCHNPVGGRAPKLAEAAGMAMEHISDPNYKGGATDVESYLMESLTDPSAYVVEGFGKGGKSPMTDFSKTLSEGRLKTLVAYLQNMAGMDVTVELPVDLGGSDDGAETAAAPTPAKTGEEALAKHGCGACHTHTGAGLEGPLAPDLTTIGATRDTTYLRRAILDPDADLAEGFEELAGMMQPSMWNEAMTISELEMIVEFLANSK